MKAEQIRKMDLMPKDSAEAIYFQIRMLQEIAAQLASFNERCEKNCSPMAQKDDDWMDPLLKERDYNKKRLKKIAEIIEQVDNRCLAADGPVSKTREEITSEELIAIYKLATGKK